MERAVKENPNKEPRYQRAQGAVLNDIQNIQLDVLGPNRIAIPSSPPPSLFCWNKSIRYDVEKAAFLFLSLSAIRLFCLYIKEPEGGIEFPWRAIKMSVSSRKWSECDIQAGMTAVEKSLALTSPSKKRIQWAFLSLSFSLSG